MISLVTIAANFEFIAIVYLTVTLFLEADISKQISTEEQAGIKFTPCIGLFFMVLLNTCTTCKYFAALRQPHEDSVNNDVATSNVYLKWRKSKCLTPHALFSILITFHNTTWLNCAGGLPLQLKKRLYLNGFLHFYQRVSWLCLFIPKGVLHVFGIYYSVMFFLGKKKASEDIVNRFDDFSIVSVA